jgi:CP12 domain
MLTTLSNFDLNSSLLVFRKGLIIMAMSEIEQQIEAERTNARAVCDVNGVESGLCAAAWDAVEELQAEASHKRQPGKAKDSLTLYCDDNPDAVECRIYDN